MARIMASKKPKVGIDLDNTLADTVGAQLKVHQGNGISIRKEEIRDLNIEQEFLRLGNINPIDSASVYGKIWTDNNIPPLDKYVTPVMEKIASLYSITILTATIATLDEIREWLSRNSIKYDNIIKIRPREKIEFARDCHIHTFVDDSPEIAGALAKTDKKLVLMHQPWNESVIKTEYIRIAKTWRDVSRLMFYK